MQALPTLFKQWPPTFIISIQHAPGVPGPRVKRVPGLIQGCALSPHLSSSKHVSPMPAQHLVASRMQACCNQFGVVQSRLASLIPKLEAIDRRPAWH